MSTYVITHKGQALETPSFINFLFNDKRASVIWLIARIWLAVDRGKPAQTGKPRLDGHR